MPHPLFSCLHDQQLSELAEAIKDITCPNRIITRLVREADEPEDTKPSFEVEK